MSNSPILIEDSNLSNAWLRVLKLILDNPGKEITPLLLSITNFEESPAFRKKLNLHLNSNGMATVETVSETIFPISLYKYLDENRVELYNLYMENFDRLKKIDASNKSGTYFQRMIAYDYINSPINQLEQIIMSLKTNKIKRRSKLQISIFDPLKDHKTAVFQGFPCLQHVTFYKSNEGGLVLNAFYALQFFYRRAYGNWLGLINLGKFVAKESGLTFERLNCYVGVEYLDEINKKEAKFLLTNIEETNVEN